MLFQGRAAAGNAYVQQCHGILDGTGWNSVQSINLGPLESGIQDQEFVRVANDNGLRRMAEFPSEFARLDPDFAGGFERLGQRHERTGLNKIGGPGLLVCLGGKPFVELCVVVVRMGDEGEKTGQEIEAESPNGDSQMRKADLLGRLDDQPGPRVQPRISQSGLMSAAMLFASFGQIGVN